MYGCMVVEQPRLVLDDLVHWLQWGHSYHWHVGWTNCVESTMCGRNVAILATNLIEVRDSGSHTTIRRSAEWNTVVSRFLVRLHIALCDHSHDFSIRTTDAHARLCNRNLRKPPPFLYFYHVSDRRVQCAIRTKNAETTVACQICNYIQMDCTTVEPCPTPTRYLYCSHQCVDREFRSVCFECHNLKLALLTVHCSAVWLDSPAFGCFLWTCRDSGWNDQHRALWSTSRQAKQGRDMPVPLLVQTMSGKKIVR